MYLTDTYLTAELNKVMMALVNPDLRKKLDTLIKLNFQIHIQHQCLFFSQYYVHRYNGNFFPFYKFFVSLSLFGNEP